MVGRDIDLIADLSTRAEVWVSLTVETDMDRVPGLPPHASPPARRLSTLAAFRDLGFKFVTLDLEGFRSGSFNSALVNVVPVESLLRGVGRS